MDFAVGQTCNSKWVIRLCRKDSKKDVKKILYMQSKCTH